MVLPICYALVQVHVLAVLELALGATMSVEQTADGHCLSPELHGPAFAGCGWCFKTALSGEVV